MQMVYKQLEEQAAVGDSGEQQLAAEEEALLHGGNQDYPQQLAHSVDNLHESNHRVRQAFMTTQAPDAAYPVYYQPLVAA